MKAGLLISLLFTASVASTALAEETAEPADQIAADTTASLCGVGCHTPEYGRRRTENHAAEREFVDKIFATPASLKTNDGDATAVPERPPWEI